jgi:hypothetical protein
MEDRWGTDETPEQIVLNGQRKNIRRNLAEAIRTIRNAEQISPLWIDAISINQDDTAERGRQVRRMGQIYDNASVVYSYIGSPDEDTEDVVTFMKELAKHPMVRSNDKGDFILSDWEATDDNENIIRPKRLAALCLKLYKLLSRQYFRRSWILQVQILMSYSIAGLTYLPGSRMGDKPYVILSPKLGNHVG